MSASQIIIENCAVATVDAAGTEHASGHIVVEGDRISVVGSGGVPEEYSGADVLRIDGRGCFATPGLVNCHHHLYQWATRGLAQQAMPYGGSTGSGMRGSPTASRLSSSAIPVCRAPAHRWAPGRGWRRANDCRRKPNLRGTIRHKQKADRESGG